MEAPKIGWIPIYEDPYQQGRARTSNCNTITVTNDNKNGTNKNDVNNDNDDSFRELRYADRPLPNLRVPFPSRRLNWRVSLYSSSAMGERGESSLELPQKGAKVDCLAELNVRVFSVGIGDVILNVSNVEA